MSGKWLVPIIPTTGATVALAMLGFLPLWLAFTWCAPVVMFVFMQAFWFTASRLEGHDEPQIISTPTYITIAGTLKGIEGIYHYPSGEPELLAYPPTTPQFIRELETTAAKVRMKEGDVLTLSGTDEQWDSERWFREARERGTPFIMNTHTKEIQRFPSLGEAMREAKLRDEDIFQATDAPTLVECPHWLAYSEGGVLVLDDIPAWRHFHPDRPLNRRVEETVTREEETAMVNQLIQKKDREPVKREAITSGSVLTLEKRIQDGFTRADFSEGLKVFSRIKKEHDLLRPLLADSGALNSLVNLKRIGQLTENLYLQGLSFLTQASDMSEQLGQTNASTLELESQELKEKLEGHEPGSALHNTITERLEKNARGLKTVKEHRDRMDEVLMEAGLCRDSMREIRLELPELVGHQSKDELEKVMLELRTRIDFAQRVHEEYTKQGL